MSTGSRCAGVLLEILEEARAAARSRFRGLRAKPMASTALSELLSGISLRRRALRDASRVGVRSDGMTAMAHPTPVFSTEVALRPDPVR